MPFHDPCTTPTESIRENIQRFGALGLQVQLTELDVGPTTCHWLGMDALAFGATYAPKPAYFGLDGLVGR